MKKNTYLCVVVDRVTGGELFDTIVESTEEYYARHLAANLFEEMRKYVPSLRKQNNWFVDSCQID